MTTIPGDSSTSASIDLNDSVTSTIDFTGDRDWFEFSVDDTQFVEVSLEGFGLGGIEDTYLRIRDSDGNIIAENDDIAFPGNLFSELDFLAVAGETYYIEAAGFEAPGFSATGDYILTTAPGEEPELIDTLVWGTQWDDLEITYYFAPDGVTNSDADGFVSDGFSTHEREQFLAAMAAIAAVTNLTFTEVSNAASADLVYILDDDQVINLPLDEQFLGFFNTPDGGTSNSGVFNANGTGWDSEPGGGLEEGGYGYVTIVHELLHGLGLAHPHDNGGTSDIMLGVSSAFGDYGDFDLNQGIFTTMSYNTGFQTGDDSVPPGFNYGYEAGPMALDIAVLQELYGANMSTNAGDTVHTLVNANATGTAWRTIWDASGDDTIQHIGGADAVIDLRAATLEYGVGGGGFVSTVDGIQGGFTIANGVVIENAIGGSGNDTLIGNDADNELTGNEGNDTLFGGEGEDDLFGGANSDTLDGGADDDQIEGGSGADTGSGGTGDDTLIAGAGNDTMSGGSGGDRIEGNSGTNTLNGGSGADAIIGGTGNDIMNGGGGDDVMTGFGGVDTMNGGRGNDTMDGRDGNDILNGGLGADQLIGGADNDVFVFNFLSDSWAGDSTRDTIFDLARGSDLIDVSGIDADLATAGDQAFNVIGTDAFNGTAGEIRFEISGADTIVQIDRNGDGAADMEIEVLNNTALDATDFIL